MAISETRIARTPEPIGTPTKVNSVSYSIHRLDRVSGKLVKLVTAASLIAAGLGIGEQAIPSTHGEKTLPPIASFGLTVAADIQSGQAKIKYPAVPTDVLKAGFAALTAANPKIRDINETFNEIIAPDKSIIGWQSVQLKNSDTVATTLAAAVQDGDDQKAMKNFTKRFVGWALGPEGPELVGTSNGIKKFANSFDILPQWVAKIVSW